MQNYFRSVVLFVVCLFSVGAYAEVTWPACVPGQVIGVTAADDYINYQSIQKGLWNAEADGLVKLVVGQGVYEEVPVMDGISGLDLLACGEVTVRGLSLKSNTDVRIVGFNFEVTPDAMGGGWTGIMVGLGAGAVNHNISIEDCNVSGSNGSGIVVAGNASNITVQGCNVHHNSGNGVEARSGSGIVVDSSSLTDNGYHGVDVRAGAEVTLAQNDIENNTWFGVSTDDELNPEAITLVDNTFNNNGGYTTWNGSHDENLGPIAGIIDATDSQPGY